MTYQYIRRRPHVKGGGNPFKTLWIERDGVYMPSIDNVLLYPAFRNGFRRFRLSRYNYNEGILSVVELPSKNQVTVGNEFKDCWSASFYIAEGQRATHEDFKLIAEVYNIPK